MQLSLEMCCEDEQKLYIDYFFLKAMKVHNILCDDDFCHITFDALTFYGTGFINHSLGRTRSMNKGLTTKVVILYYMLHILVSGMEDKFQTSFQMA